MPLTAPITASNPSGAFERLLTIMDDLRMNCPWDKKQTLESLRHLTIEETYELSDAILSGDMDEIKKSLAILCCTWFFTRV
jgi:XTP/dITP diphosphohydrolase